MDSITLMAMASEEACRLLEQEFSFNNLFTVVIKASEIPITQRERFYSLVEEELRAKGEKIDRCGKYFKICRYQKK